MEKEFAKYFIFIAIIIIIDVVNTVKWVIEMNLNLVNNIRI